MAKKPLHAQDKEGFLRAFTDEWADLEAEHEVLVTFAMNPARQKGVLELRVSAWGEGERRGGFPKAKYTTSYPTSAVATFEAALYQALIRLGAQLREQKRWPMGKA